MAQASIVLPASPDGDDWTIVGDVGHSAALLPDGTVLIAGGNDDAGAPVATAQIWNPATATVHGTAAMTTPRSGHSMTLLPDGRVLVAGGTDGNGDLASLEVFDPATGSFSALSASLATARRGQEATAMNDGHVLIQAGADNGVAVTSKELFDSADDSIAAAGSLNGVALASVATDRGDYSPGDHVGVSGAGWQPGETVALLFDETPIEHWPHVVTVVAGADGKIANSDYQLEAHDLGTSFVLTATGMTSGATAQAVFTDSNPVLSYAPTAPSLSAMAGAGTSFMQNIVAPALTGDFTITVLVQPTTVQGSTPMPASWVTTSPTSFHFLLPDDKTRSTTWQVNVSVPLGTPAARYTANIKAQPAGGTVDPGNGSALSVTVQNTPPVANAGGPYTVPEGGTVQLAGTASDANNDALTIQWDLDANGTFETTGLNPVFSAGTRDGPGTQRINFRVCDPTTCTTATGTVNITNTAPTATFVSPTDALNEGTSFALSLISPSDPSAADVAAGFRYAFDCGTGGGYGPPTTAASASCATPDNGVLSVGGKILDKDGGTTEYRASVTVNNVAPNAVFIAPATGSEGSPFELTLTNSTDPSTADTSAGFSYAFDCGDGNGFGPFGTAPAASCTPADDGSYPVHGAIRDKDGGTSTYDATVAVANVAPTAQRLDNDGPIHEGASATVTVIGAFDPSSADTAAGLHFAYGCDGKAPAGATYASSSPNSASSCSFDDNGSYPVVARVIDKDGAFNDYSTTVIVNNVAPTARLTNDGPIDEGANASVTFTDQFDPSNADRDAGFHYAFACNGESLAGAHYANSGSSASSSCHYDENGNYTVVAVIFDKDDGATNATTVVVVGEVPPSAVFSNNGPIFEGGNVTVTFSDPTDPSNGDTAPGFHYAVACHGESLDGTTYAGAVNSTSFGCAFDDNGTFPVKGRIIEEDGTFTDYTTQVVVLNLPPTGVIGNSGPIQEGGNATVAFTNVFDPSPVDLRAGLHYAFSCDGSPLGGTSYASASAFPATSCTFDDNGEHDVRARVIDKDGGFTDYSTTVSVTNVAPTATLSNDSGPIEEGGSAIISFTNAFDPSRADGAAGFHYAFDCSGNAPADSTYADSSAESSTSCKFDDNGSFTVAGRIIDKDGGFTDYTTTVDVSNVNATADLVAPETVNEGDAYALALINASDPSSVDTAAGFRYAFDCGDGVFGPLGADPAADCSGVDSRSGPRTVRGRIVDKDGGDTVRTAVVTVLNVAPTATLSNDGSVAEGSPAVIRFTEPSDPGPADTAAGFHYAFHCDGTPVTDATYLNSETSPTTQCVFNQEGEHTVSGRIIDQDDGYTEYTTTVTVTNVAPVITDTSGPSAPVDVGTAVTVNANFTDGSADDSHTCSVDWGDGQTSDGTVTESSGDGSCTATHAYSAPGSFTVTVTVTDDDGATATATLTVNVAQPQATGGLTFGSGEIKLPSGADPAHPWVNGKAVYAFAAQGGNGRPLRGITDFLFLRDGFVFSSSRVDTLSVTGNTAVYGGSGYVNGRSGYRYTVTVVGRKSCGKPGADELRLQVVKSSTGAVVFDSSPGAPDGETAPVTLGFTFVQSF